MHEEPGRIGDMPRVHLCHAPTPIEAMAGFIRRANGAAAGRSLLFLHTGGSPALFTYTRGIGQGNGGPGGELIGGRSSREDRDAGDDAYTTQAGLGARALPLRRRGHGEERESRAGGERAAKPGPSAEASPLQATRTSRRAESAVP